MISFDKYHAMTVPEGEVKHITDSRGRRLWHRRRHEITDRKKWHILTDAADEPIPRLTVYGETVYGDNLADMQAAAYPETKVLDGRFSYYDKPYWLYYFNVSGDLFSMDEGLTVADDTLTFQAGWGEEEGCGQLMPVTSGNTYEVRFETTCRQVRLYQLADGILRGSMVVFNGNLFVPAAGVNSIIVGFFPMDGSSSGQTDVFHTVSALRVRPVSGIENPVVSVYGKNILSDEALVAQGWTPQEDGSFYVVNPNVVYTKTIFQPNGYQGKITVSYDYKFSNQGKGGAHPCIFYKNNPSVPVRVVWPSNAFEYTHFKVVFTIDDTVDRIAWAHADYKSSTWIKNVQLEFGSAETAYEPCVVQRATVGGILKAGDSAVVPPLTLRTNRVCTSVVCDAPCVVEYILEEE